jgi:hypothetical protein
MTPSCGLTRGMVALVRGPLADAMRFNPASPIVLLGGLALLALGVLTGRWLDVRLRVEWLGWLLFASLAGRSPSTSSSPRGLLRG